MKLLTPDRKLIRPTRRALLGGLGLAVCAPAIVRAGSMSLLGAGKSSAGGAPTFLQGIYFRATNNQVSPTNYDVETDATSYPRTSAQGHTVGWETFGISSVDRDVTTDVRLKGINFFNNGSPQTYRIDLPAPGTYKIQLAMGDSGFAHRQKFVINDTSSALFTNDFVDTVGSNQWGDATGVVRTSEADWVANNAIKTLTFTTTICRFVFGGSTGVADANNTIAAVFVSN